jgi:hypothetical protein
MAQDASGLTEGAKGIADKVQGFFDKIPNPSDLFAKKPDTSWHDSMVKAANKSFQTKTEGASRTQARKPVKRKSVPYKTAQ